MAQVRKTFSLSEETIKKLEKAAKNEHRTMSIIIELAIALYLKEVK